MCVAQKWALMNVFSIWVRGAEMWGTEMKTTLSGRRRMKTWVRERNPGSQANLAPLWATHTFLSQFHTMVCGPSCSSVYGGGFFSPHGECLWRWEMLSGEFWCRPKFPPSCSSASCGHCGCAAQYVWWPALFVNLIQLWITWEDYINKGWSALGWFVGMSVGDCLNSDHWFGKTQPTVGDAIP